MDLGYKRDYMLNLFKARQVIESAKTIVLTCHLFHDGDALGSMLALYNMLQDKKKEAIMILNEEIAHNFKFLVGAKKIKQLKGETINCDLFIIVDKDAIQDNRCGSYGTIVNSLKKLNIDHHIGNKECADVNILDNKAGACGELVYDLLQYMEQKITPQIAECLYVSIVSDTGYFGFGNTTKKTLLIAGNLIKFGVNPQRVAEFLKSRLPHQVKCLAKVLNTFEIYNKNIGILTINNKLYKEIGLENENYVNYARYSKGIEAASYYLKKSNIS